MLVSPRTIDFQGTKFPQLKQRSAGTIWTRANRNDRGSALACTIISGCVYLRCAGHHRFNPCGLKQIGTQAGFRFALPILRAEAYKVRICQQGWSIGEPVLAG